ncbi:MAG: adenylate/guanylate cyclase domain-containing protein, partial [Litorilinea sp.]
MPDQEPIVTDTDAKTGADTRPAHVARDESTDHRRLLSAALPFVASDRVQDLLGVRPLARGGWGAALFADLSGFTALSRTLVEELGPRRGAERATHTLNTILERIIAPVHDWGGSVLAFSGDGFLCWFPVPTLDDEESEAAVEAALAAGVQVAVGCALHMQRALPDPDTGDELAGAAVQTSSALGLKVGVAGGYAWRFVVGEPSIQLLDAIAGARVAQAVDAQGYAQSGEIWVARAVVGLLPEFVHPVRSQGENKVEDDFASGDAEPADPRESDAAAVQIAGTGLLPDPPIAVVPIADLHAAAVAALTSAQIQPWLPQFVWGRLQAGQSRFLAELRPAVAVFARFAETQMGDTPTSQALLAAYVGWVQEVFQHAGGTVIQLTLGDKGSYIYGVLGAPVQHDDVARSAAQVAQQLAQGPPDGEFRPQAQVGVAQGRMRAGEYGSATRRTYGVQGSAVNLAARLMMLASPGNVFADPAVATLMETYFELTPLPPEQLRGFVAPVRVYQLADAPPRRTAQEPFAHMYLVRRSDLLARLEERWQRADAAGLTVCHLVGEAGSGKSALLWQFAQECPTEALNINCRVAATGSAYGLFVALLGQLLDIGADMQSEAAWSA